MTTYFAVQPTNSGAPQFLPTFDGAQYSVRLVWSLFGQRFYANCYDINGVLQFSRPVVESLVGVDLQTLTFDELRGVAVGQTSVEHGYPAGSTLRLTVSGVTPTDYNGTFDVLVTGDNTFSYPLAVSSDPGDATTPGRLSYDISICAGYFSSTLVFRNGQFEVAP